MGPTTARNVQAVCVETSFEGQGKTIQVLKREELMDTIREERRSSQYMAKVKRNSVTGELRLRRKETHMTTGTGQVRAEGGFNGLQVRAAVMTGRKDNISKGG